MATIKDVAKLANVSVATVSRVINNSNKVSPEAKEAVLKAQNELNYHPNITPKVIQHQSSDCIGVVVADCSDPYFGTMVRSIDAEAVKNGMHITVVNGYHNAQKELLALKYLICVRCNCIIAHTPLIDDADLANIMTTNKSIVLINRNLPGFEDRCILIDDLTGAYLAVKHLIANGHRNIAYIKSLHQIDDATLRFEGYLKALEEAKIPFNNNLIIEAEPTAQGGEDGAQMLLNSSQPFTAIACYNDMQAAGAMAILIDNDIKIPDNVSIIGYDNIFISRYLQPRLTTILNPVMNMATIAVKLAISITKGDDTSNFPRTFTPTLIKRFSVKDLRGI
ncbi:MAG: substrate-binding domain-containing protein [Succinivibrionaceae bacterium]